MVNALGEKSLAGWYRQLRVFSFEGAKVMILNDVLRWAQRIFMVTKYTISFHSFVFALHSSRLILTLNIH